MLALCQRRHGYRFEEPYEAVPTIKPDARWHYEVARAFKMSYGRRVRGCSDRLGWLPETLNTSI